MQTSQTIRRLVVILGDQLNEDSLALVGFHNSTDVIWMAETKSESTHVPSHKARTAIFLSAMRHYCDYQHSIGRKVIYRHLRDREKTIASALEKTITDHAIEKVVFVKPGEMRVENSLRHTLDEHHQCYEILEDNHFICNPRDFSKFGDESSNQRLEFFYRKLRKTTGVLMDSNIPVGGSWNYDKENRSSFPKSGPEFVPEPVRFVPGPTTQEVMANVISYFPDNPGKLDDFNWPVTRGEALEALDDFITNRLSHFGEYQDAMWFGQSWLYHSRLSVCLNLKLLNPREVILAAESAYHQGAAPLASVEGFIRQILGWREFVRLIYLHRMPDYGDSNALGAKEPLPDFYWTGKTEMVCLRECIGQTLNTGYNHHIQRLMVTGLYSLLLGVHPKFIHEWFLSMYVDAVEWVELPNVIGMSQYADGGVMGSKPYIATGKYINRMSNYCCNCVYDPNQSTGENACPFTTLYWDFLDRHQSQMAGNHRMILQLKNLERLENTERELIREKAQKLRQNPRLSTAG